MNESVCLIACAFILTVDAQIHLMIIILQTNLCIDCRLPLMCLAISLSIFHQNFVHFFLLFVDVCLHLVN